MKIHYAVVFAGVAVLGLGAIVGRGLAAPAKAPVYVIVDINEITDADAFKDVLKMGPADIVEAKAADGRFIARTENVTALDGAAPKGFVIIAFDNAKKARSFYDNTKASNAMRMKATKSRAFLVEGL
jgi:uncharacterized protein (DUF1330 family)